MAKKVTTTAAQWLRRLIRRALLWARKGGAINCWLVTKGRNSSKLCYKEYELSFDETPTFRLEMFKPKFCCNDPAVDSGDEHCEYNNYYDDDKNSGDASCLECDRENHEHPLKHEDGGVDRKADEFIAKFYQQVRLQRELSMQLTQNHI